MILSILLNILMWIFFIFLILIAVFLFAPVHYRVEGNTGQDTRVSAKISWLFWLLRIFYNYGPEKSDITIKIGPYKLPKLSKDKPPKKKLKKEKTGFSMNFSDTKSLLTKLDIKTIISLGKILIKKLLRKIGPKRFLLQGVVGFDDPCTTGQFIGLYEAATGAAGLRDKFDLKGDYYQKKFSFDLKMSGRFAIASLLWPLIWFLLQKPVRNAIKLSRKTG